MKKVLFAAALAATFGVFADGIESSNVVGYNTAELDAETGAMLNVGVAFKNIGVADGSFTVTDTIFGRAVGDGDQLLIFNLGGWDLDIYAYTEGVGWDAAFADGTASSVENIPLAKGQAFMYMPAVPEDVMNVSGEVDLNPAPIVFDPEEEAMFSLVNPLPIDTTFAELSSWVGDGDQIVIFNCAGWDLDIYAYTEGVGWDAAYANGEAGHIDDETQVLLPAGTGAYFLPADVRTWTVKLGE